MSDELPTTPEVPVESGDLFSRVCLWLNRQADSEMDLAEKLASFRSYKDAAESERKARIFRLVKCVVEEIQAEIHSENADGDSSAVAD